MKNTALLLAIFASVAMADYTGEFYPTITFTPPDYGTATTLSGHLLGGFIAAYVIFFGLLLMAWVWIWVDQI